MIYVVSGWQRTGTSMMMQALIAGGMDAAWDEAKDQRLAANYRRRFGTQPNEKYYEFEKAEYDRPGFPAAHDGKLIKALYGAIPKLNAGLQYHVIYMRRPQHQIVESLVSSLGRGAVGNTGRGDFVTKQEKAIAWMQARPGQFLSVHEVWYQAVLDDPAAVFAQLKDAGWPIDVSKAAAVPDKAKQRFVA
jgi:hypothetical protein